MNGFFLLAQSEIAQSEDASQQVTQPPQSLLESIEGFVQAFTDPDKLAAFAGNILAAIAIYLVGKIVVRILTGLLERVMTRAKVDATLSSFLSNIAHYVLITFVILMALESLGVDTTSLAAIMGAAGLAVGFALQSSLSNFASGVMIILFKPFRVGDFIDAGGVSGTVEEISIFSTLMKTGDNKQIIVPNGAIYGGNIINYSAKPTRRIDMVVGCGYGDDLRAVKAFLTILVETDERILKDPAPVVAVSALADNSVNFVVRPWVNSADYWAVLWDLNERVKLGFDERGFNIPYPQRDIHIHQAAS
jgi:small conductance mechanosensitive channel